MKIFEKILLEDSVISILLNKIKIFIFILWKIKNIVKLIEI